MNGSFFGRLDTTVRIEQVFSFEILVVVEGRAFLAIFLLSTSDITSFVERARVCAKNLSADIHIRNTSNQIITYDHISEVNIKRAAAFHCVITCFCLTLDAKELNDSSRS